MLRCLVCSLDAVVRGLAVDASTGKIYFTTKAVVEVINPDGSQMKTLIEHSNETKTYDVAVDVASR